ncbi:2,3-bisphosphoglycerate-dependent phosphoglycerate mutase [Actinotalea sp. BY-33]|uniref:2,3-bisphosphoglycerate-dependent phosphoglycerate mutase n=1 Tax=Actinotalea soli TaxID=2819234 RepID=A0A939LPL9_9CELL|nr:2,3-bisphosphoglycerate-dependent phosphoglycerate mutase [Actinotalea soli]MBO1751604.1 2,3-bisphosphoglycerate-dependent phosphoglycerate mutase [Actinotalea soli]
MTGVLLLLRHGQSTANASKTFTGLLDVGLTELGSEQARAAAHLMTADGLRPDEVVTSPMRRAARTAELAVAAGGWQDVPLRSSWRLAERDYGNLTDVPKAEARAALGPEAYLSVRRTLHGSPPPASADQAAGWGAAYTDPGSGLPQPGAGESLHDVVERVRPEWQRLRVALDEGRTVLVVAHGNSLRALCLLVDDLSEDEVRELNLPAGHPLRYDLTAEGAVLPRGGAYLDADSAQREAERIAHEGGT